MSETATAVAHLPAAQARQPLPQPAKAVVVHSGARDAYQVARAFEESGLLEELVTDLFWREGASPAPTVQSLVPASLRRMLRQRTEPALARAHIHQLLAPGVLSLALERVRAPRAIRRTVMRGLDRQLGRAAGRAARKSGAGLLSYSYYAYDAFQASGQPGMLFQLHPHPASMRQLLTRELEGHPECAASLQQEWELALPEDDYRRLCAEPAMADSILVASSFTRSTLVENGVDSRRIQVVPYGVDAARFRPDAERRRRTDGPLRLLFVGRINQRKGISYLLEALRLLGPAPLDLTICGRVVDDLSLFKPFADRITIRPDVSEAELRAAYQAADLFVFPSVAEGFGQVLLEALASGLPILSTTHTAAPDLIDSGREGFVVEPRRPDLLAERIDWALMHREQLAAMRHEARGRAELFTWARFRKGVVDHWTRWSAGRNTTQPGEVPVAL